MPFKFFVMLSDFRHAPELREAFCFCDFRTVSALLLCSLCPLLEGCVLLPNAMVLFPGEWECWHLLPVYRPGFN